MRLLLDSHVALWWLEGDRTLGPRANAAVERADEVRFSVVTPWEIGLKVALGKLVLPGDVGEALVQAGFEPLPITLAHASAAPSLPPHHRDPFDRMLIAQARLDAFTIVTADRAFGAYEVDLFDAVA